MAETQHYYRMSNGLLQITAMDSAPPATPAGATVITATEYNNELATLEAARDQRVADQRVLDTQQQQDAYTALTAAGIPEVSARQLSGYWTGYAGAGGQGGE